MFNDEFNFSFKDIPFGGFDYQKKKDFVYFVIIIYIRKSKCSKCRLLFVVFKNDLSGYFESNMKAVKLLRLCESLSIDC